MKTDLKAPFPVTLEPAFLAHMKKSANKRMLDISSLIRLSLADFDMRTVERDEPNAVQISVRLDPKTRKVLRATARKKDVSTGKIIRQAVETYLKKSTK